MYENQPITSPAVGEVMPLGDAPPRRWVAPLGGAPQPYPLITISRRSCVCFEPDRRRGLQYQTMDEFLHIAEHVLEHSVADTLYLIPILFVTYVVMEWLEHRTGHKAQEAVKRAGAAGPIVGALVGVVPQCGFSAVAATLWAGRVITFGTFFAVLLSTSDEMLPILIAEQAPIATILKILGVKIMIGMVMGFAADAMLRVAHRDNQKLRIHEICAQDNCHCTDGCTTCHEHPELVYEHTDDCCQTCTHEHHHHDHDHDAGWKQILKSALIHTIQITIFIFIITVILNTVLEVVGEDALGSFLSSNQILAIFGAALIGLIPNCAPSIVIAQLYMEGVLGAGAMLSGLLVSAGVGLLVLIRTNRHPVQNVIVIVFLYATGVFWGLLVNLLGITF